MACTQYYTEAMNFADVVKNLPDNPGIYLYYNKDKELIYVGKATSLKDRVSSYFRGQRTPRPIEAMIHEVERISWQETDSVLEAIIAEANAIKKYQPKYNVDGKDDKSWNYIVITKEEYPQVLTVRQREYDTVIARSQQTTKQSKDGNKIASLPATVARNDRYLYMFGPYPGLNTKATMKLLRRMFRFSACQKEKRKKFIGKPCLYRQMGLCLGVCTREITPKDYRHIVIRPLALFLSGRKKQVLKDFEKEMKRAVKEERFEDAARLRDQIASLQRIHDMALLSKGFFEKPVIARSPQTTKQSMMRIEGYDISNLGMTGKVGSMVVFTGGEPDKSQYRKFKIRTVEGQSDVDCLEEVLRRRLKHTEWSYPAVFLIDGGAPQVHRAVAVFKDLGVTVPIVGIAKGPERKRNDFFFGNKNPGFVQWVSKHQETLIKVRDEAHRFAITYQRTLRKLP